MWTQNKEKLGVMGHRGCCGYMPENTLISFREAFRQNVDFLEFDVQMTRDGHLVVIHDDMVNRTTDGIGAVNFMTLEELKALDAGVKFGYPGQRIPTLAETLDCIVKEAPKHMYIDLEIKDQRPYVVDKTIEMLEAYGLLDKTVIQPPARMLRFEERVLENACALAVPLRFSDAEIEELIALAEKYGLEAWAYHTDTTEQVERAMQFPFTNLTANDPNAVIAYLDSHGRRAER